MTLLKLGEHPREFALRDGRKAEIRPLTADDKVRLRTFFELVPEEERFYLKENVVAPEVIKEWTEHIDHDRVIPIVAVMGDEIVADATLHRSRAEAYRYVGEARVVVSPAYRELGLGSRLIRELIDTALMLRLHKMTMELVEHRERPAIMAAKAAGFMEVAVLKERVRDPEGNYEDLVLLELPLEGYANWWHY